MRGTAMLMAMGLWATLAQAAGAAGLTLVEKGKTDYGIVVADEATPPEATAAAELQRYLKQSTGADFRVVTESAYPRGRPAILVGRTRRTGGHLRRFDWGSLGTDGIVIRTAGRDLILAGGRPRGTLYAVYSFLEDDLGCRWLTWYGDESVPRRETLTVPELHRREAPAMAVRDIVCHMNPNAGGPHLQRFLVRNRGQGPDLRFTGDLAEVGGTSHRFAFPPKGWLVHTLFQWVPPEKHFQAHPEWFSLAGDERVSTRQLCFSNPGLRKALTDAILQRIGEADPGGMYSVSAMDWDGAFCDCAACRTLVAREGTPGAPLFDYLAELGPPLKARFPEALVSTLAYRKEQSEIPPRTLRLPDNVVILFAPILGNFGAALEHPSNADTLRNLEHWKRATAHLWVWYYPNPYGPALPIGNLHRLAQDFRLFKRLGVEGCYVEQDAPGVYDARRATDLQTWLITKLMWNPERDPDALVADFTGRYYGSAARHVRRYLADLESATARQRTPLSWNAPLGQHRFLTPELLLCCQRVLDQAERTVANDAAALSRVGQLRMSLDLACLMRWTQLSTAARVPFTLRQLTNRYRETYTEAIQSRLPQAEQPASLTALADSLRWYERMTPLKPLPPPLDRVPRARVRQFTPEAAQLRGEAPPRAKDPAAAAGVLVQDPAAAAGIAAMVEPHRLTPPDYAPKDLPAHVLNMGFYDGVTGREQHAYAGKEAPVVPGLYRLYPLGRTALNPHSFVWFDWSWHLQFPDISSLYDPADAAKQWDLYASIRFEGPAYDPKSTLDRSRFLVDRVVLVEARP